MDDVGLRSKTGNLIYGIPCFRRGLKLAPKNKVLYVVPSESPNVSDTTTTKEGCDETEKSVTSVRSGSSPYPASKKGTQNRPRWIMRQGYISEILPSGDHVVITDYLDCNSGSRMGNHSLPATSSDRQSSPSQVQLLIDPNLGDTRNPQPASTPLKHRSRLPLQEGMKFHEVSNGQTSHARSFADMNWGPQATTRDISCQSRVVHIGHVIGNVFYGNEKVRETGYGAVLSTASQLVKPGYLSRLERNNIVIPPRSLSSESSNLTIHQQVSPRVSIRAHFNHNIYHEWKRNGNQGNVIKHTTVPVLNVFRSHFVVHTPQRWIFYRLERQTPKSIASSLGFEQSGFTLTATVEDTILLPLASGDMTQPHVHHNGGLQSNGVESAIRTGLDTNTSSVAASASTRVPSDTPSPANNVNEYNSGSHEQERRESPENAVRTNRVDEINQGPENTSGRSPDARQNSNSHPEEGEHSPEVATLRHSMVAPDVLVTRPVGFISWLSLSLCMAYSGHWRLVLMQFPLHTDIYSRYQISLSQANRYIVHYTRMSPCLTRALDRKEVEPITIGMYVAAFLDEDTQRTFACALSWKQKCRVEEDDAILC